MSYSHLITSLCYLILSFLINSSLHYFIPHAQVTVFRRAWAMVLEREENWKESASILIGIPLDSGHRCGMQYCSDKIEAFFFQYCCSF
jgi:hypothetical protein